MGTSLHAAVDALVAAGRGGGVDEATARAEASALSACVAADVPGADRAWAEAVGGHVNGLAAAARAGALFTRRATPVLARLVAGGSDAAEPYARALADVASAACSLGDPSLDAVSNASVIAAMQLDVILAPAVAPAGGGPDLPAPVTNPSSLGGSEAGAAQTVADVIRAASSGLAGVTTAGGADVRGSGVAKPLEAAPAPASAPAPAEPAESLTDLLDELDDLVGLQSVKTEVRHQAEVLRVAKLRAAKQLRDPELTRHLVFVGNPGTGKTTVARLVARIYRALGVLPGGQLVECDRSSLVAGYVGQTALKTAEMAKKALGGALFIDEAYALADDDFGEEAIETLVKHMEDHRGELVVIVAGYPEPMERFIDANPGLASRFRLTLTFADYSDDELVEIFSKITAEADFTPAEDCTARLRAILALTPRDTGFGNGRFVRSQFESAVVRQAWRLRDVADPSVEQLRQLEADDLGEPPDTLHPPESVEPADAGTPAEPATSDAATATETDAPAEPTDPADQVAVGTPDAGKETVEPELAVAPATAQDGANMPDPSALPSVMDDRESAP